MDNRNTALLDFECEPTLEDEGGDEALAYEVKAPPVRGQHITLDRFASPANEIPFVSFFTGCGGMDLGFEAAGFTHMAAAEISPTFVATLRANRPAWKVLGPPESSGDVSDVYSLAAQLRLLGVGYDFEGVFIGGPPCQPFSIAANQRFNKNGENFKRTGFQHVNGSLLFNYIDLIELFLPRAFVVENVSGLVDVDGGEQIASAVDRLQRMGYIIEEPAILNASDYLIPQHRYRLFLIGHRGANHFSLPKKAGCTLPVAPALVLGENHVSNHQPRVHKAESLLRYMRLDIGERDQLGRVDRLDPRRPSKTIIAGGTQGGGRSHLHPYVPRTLTVRECARIQTFPDDYVFTGPIARQFTQVGNAVPPILAAQIARSITNLF